MIVPVDTTELVQVWLFVTRMCFVWSSGRVHVRRSTYKCNYCVNTQGILLLSFRIWQTVC